MPPCKAIRLGYELGTGKEVDLPLHHIVVTGVTQLSGKTTTLESLIRRSGLRAIAFRTKRGESDFSGAHRHAPFFQEKSDWQFVQSLLEATMRERMKFERSWIIKVCKGARSLRDVQRNVEKELQTAKRLDESVYTNLKAYLDLVLPEIERTPMTKALVLKQGINVMDLVGLRDEVQSLVIASTVEAVQRTEKDVVVVIPEAWKFAPEGRGNPVKKAAESLVRQGASVGIYLWLDSQDIAGIDKALLKQVDNWILGRQREFNEVEHTLDQIPKPAKLKPRPEEIMSLGIGQFVACFDDQVRKVYVQPWWLGEDAARCVALGTVDVRAAMEARPKQSKEDDMSSELAERLKVAEERNKKLEADLNEALEALREAKVVLKDSESLRTAERTRALNAHNTENTRNTKITENKPGQPEKMFSEGLVQAVIDRLRSEPGVKLVVGKSESEISLIIERSVISASDSTIKGRLALLIMDGFFDSPKGLAEVRAEAKARGWGVWSSGYHNVKVPQELRWMQEAYFLRKEGEQWTALPGVKGRVRA
jgi:hypothetical protein